MKLACQAETRHTRQSGYLVEAVAGAALAPAPAFRKRGALSEGVLDLDRRRDGRRQAVVVERDDRVCGHDAALGESQTETDRRRKA